MAPLMLLMLREAAAFAYMAAASPFGDIKWLLLGDQNIQHPMLFQPGILLCYGRCSSTTWAQGGALASVYLEPACVHVQAHAHAAAADVRVHDKRRYAHLMPLATEDLTWLVPDTSNFLNMTAAVQKLASGISRSMI